MNNAAFTWQDVDAPPEETGGQKGRVVRRNDASGGSSLVADRRSHSLLLDADTGSPADRLDGPSLRYYMVLTAFGRRYHLNQMLMVEVGPGDDLPVMVFAPALGVGGVGATLESALTDMGDTAVMVWESHRATPREQRDGSVRIELDRLDAYLLGARHD
jgi:hypothetical protein